MVDPLRLQLLSDLRAVLDPITPLRLAANDTCA